MIAAKAVIRSSNVYILLCGTVVPYGPQTPTTQDAVVAIQTLLTGQQKHAQSLPATNSTLC
jgi:hypothetical protein